MRISDIDVFPIYPALIAANARQKARFNNLNNRTIFRVRTDNGVVGYGDVRNTGAPRSAEEQKRAVEHLLGRNPFDFLGANLNAGLMGALYDVMGKYLEIPAWKLMGQKVRDRVPVAAWTRPASPEDLAAAVQRAAKDGYMIFKMHACAYFDLLEQNDAAEQAAPHGFKMHYDLNGNRTLAAVSRLVKELECSPIVAAIEDPLKPNDLDGWRRLREQTRVPIVMHNPMLGVGPEILHGCADAFMEGERGIGTALAHGFACGAANLSTVIQLTGGTLTKALALHLGAVLPNVSHSINLDDQYEEDVVVRRIDVVEGASPVPQGPGLGVEVDEAALAECAAKKPDVIPPTIGILRLPGGRRIYTRSLRMYTQSFPDIEAMTGFPEGHLRGIRLDVWEQDGTDAFRTVWDRLEREESFME